MGTTNFLRWRKSSFSNDSGTACVEVAFNGDEVFIRDSKYTGDPAAQPVIMVTAAQWHTFLGAALRGGAATPAIVHRAGGGVTLSRNGVDLVYTPAEWAAFTAGAVAGEFSRSELLSV